MVGWVGGVVGSIDHSQFSVRVLSSQ